MHVFLDLWGVLLDSDRMQMEYGRELARQMAARFGGSEERWLRAHTAAWTEYVRGTESADFIGRPWSETVDRLDAQFAARILESSGVAWRPSDPVAFSRELDVNVMSQIDARFPDARIAVERLRTSGHKVYVATQATESNARGALTGAGLLGSIDGLFTGSSQDSPKSRGEYWARIRQTLDLSDECGVAVDDRLDYLEAAASIGFLGLLLDREEIFASEPLPRYIRATLRNLAGLPHYIETLSSEAYRATG